MSAELQERWNTHRAADWPRFSSAFQGELMTLDTVISGCVAYYLDNPDGLGEQRRGILESCRQDLDGLVPDLPENALPYFLQLVDLAACLSRLSQAPHTGEAQGI